jgi:uncharacterized protein (TIRG00374 family)
LSAQHFTLRNRSRSTGIVGHDRRNTQTAVDALVSMILGILAWSLTSFCFVLLLRHLGVSLPIMSALAIYPLAMLAGAASMLPGGVGTTEVTLVALLSLFNVPLETATLAAIGIRFASMWFSVLCGLVAMSSIELFFYRSASVRVSKDC